MTSFGGLLEFEAAGLKGVRRRGKGRPTIVLLHGYGGDETVMWIFAPPASQGFPVISLRGIEAAAEGGYRWHVGPRWPPPAVSVFDESVSAIRSAIVSLGLDGPVLWAGFSQGAALAFACAARGLPTLGVACLAGYLPSGIESFPRGLPVFWAHGTRDDRVPIDIARAGMERLRLAGAAVDACEDDVGHRLSSGCVRALLRWFDRFRTEGEASVLSSGSPAPPR